MWDWVPAAPFPICSCFYLLLGLWAFTGSGAFCQSHGFLGGGLCKSRLSFRKSQGLASLELHRRKLWDFIR